MARECVRVCLCLCLQLCVFLAAALGTQALAAGMQHVERRGSVVSNQRTPASLEICVAATRSEDGGLQARRDVLAASTVQCLGEATGYAAHHGSQRVGETPEGNPAFIEQQRAPNRPASGQSTGIARNRQESPGIVAAAPCV